MSGRLIFWSITSALAGFLFGFDTVVISGAEKDIQSLWQLTAAMHGVAIGSALYGTVVGSLIGGWPSDRYGRRNTLMFIGMLYLAGAIGSASASDVYSFAAARFLGGLGIGISTIVAPLYISEIAPPKHRGLLAGMFQFNIVFGILVAYLSNALFAGVGPNAWRWMLGVATFPSLLYTVLCYALPESPRWLLCIKSDEANAKRTLRAIRPDATLAEIEDETAAIKAANMRTHSTGKFWSASLRAPISLAFFVAFFNQMSGINAILYFAPRIFELTGLGARAALLQSVGIGLTNLIFTLIGIWLIDRLGRRTLLYIGSIGYIASLSLVAFAFFTSHYAIVPACIFAFIAAHAVGQGAVIWVYISEIFPNRQRAQGQALGSFTHWFFAALLTTVFPVVVSGIAPGYVFSFFAAMMVLQLWWVRASVVETKGASLEHIQRSLGTLGLDP
jgi:sugar porter (SP) family MFS transporter